MTEQGGLMLEMRQTLPAPREEVYALFADAEQIARWWGPAGFAIPSLDFVAEAGRPYRIEMQPPEGESFFLRGEFREVQPPARLAYTFVWEDPDPDDRETLVTLEFGEVDDGTEVRFTQGPFATEARRELHDGGWSDGFVKLRDLTRPG